MKTATHQLVLFCLFFICTAINTTAQVGINTTDPEGALDIVATDQGVVMPRVSAVENVVTPNGNPAVDGTIVYDLSRNQMCMRINGAWVCTDISGSNATIYDNGFTTVSAYIKASNTETIDRFGQAISMSADGNYLAIGARNEDSNATGINGDETNNSGPVSGAVYVFVRSGSTWTQQAYIKASNAESGDFFGTSVDLSSDGTYLAVGATGESSNATGVNGNESDNSEGSAGAVYVFIRSGTTWSQQAYIKASNAETNDLFGENLSLSDDGSYLAIGADGEDSNAVGINGNESDNTAGNAGAVYIFTRSGTVWSQQAYIKASNAEASDFFADSLSISTDGSYLAVGAIGESSNVTGVNGNESDNTASVSGAVYIFTRSGVTWSQQAYIKASNTGTNDVFGISVSLSDDGSYLAVGATGDDSNATEINGDGINDDANGAGAVFVFSRSGAVWTQIAYVKAPNSRSADGFGTSVALSGDSSRLVVGASGEDSSATGINGDQTNDDASSAGAVYSFEITGSSISFNGYIKASNTDNGDTFGFSIALNADGSRLLVGAYNEDSNATGVGGSQSNNSASSSGAAYIIE